MPRKTELAGRDLGSIAPPPPQFLGFTISHICLFTTEKGPGRKREDVIRIIVRVVFVELEIEYLFWCVCVRLAFEMANDEVYIQSSIISKSSRELFDHRLVIVIQLLVVKHSPFFFLPHASKFSHRTK